MKIKTFNGNIINQSVKIDLEDIAHSLSNQCLFFGHTKIYISYAEFSVRLSSVIGISNLCNYALLYNSWKAFDFLYQSPKDLSYMQNRIIRLLGLSTDYNLMIGEQIMKSNNTLMTYVYNHYIEDKPLEEDEKEIPFGLSPEDSKNLFIETYKKYM